MNRILLMTTVALAAMVCPRPGHCQTAVQAWVQRYHGPGDIQDVPLAMAVAGSGNVVVTGYSTDLYDDKSWVTVAYSSAGMPLWTNRYSSPVQFTDAQPNAVAVDTNGNVFVTGVSSASSSGQDYTTIKYSSAGVPLWTRRYNGPGNGNDGANAVVVDASGNVVVTGSSVGTNGLSSYFDYATIKYSNAGVPLWTNRYNGPANNEDGATDVAVNGSGNVFVTGYSYTIEGTADYVTIAYSSAGVPLWTNRYNGPGDNSDYARAVAVDGNGNVFVTGESWGGSETDYATIKYSPAGVPLWTNRYHGSFAVNNFAKAMAVDGNGNVFVTGGDGGVGSTNGGYATIKYSDAGVPLWTNHYNGPMTAHGYLDQAGAVVVDGSGNVVVTGQSYRDLVTITDYDYATIAYSNAGVPLWTNRYNGPANGDDGFLTKRSLALGPDGSVYVSGASDGDPSDGTSFDFATIKYTVSGSAPALHIARSNALVIISWPSPSTGFQLQQNTNLNTTQWTTPSETITDNGTTRFISVGPTPGARFFRLFKP